ncbi:hypothetical protein FRB97_009291 [Tulasnella sp. 331]|nr:hypothetical protein FRB97_009291 [Tulasnella sp. 331]
MPPAPAVGERYYRIKTADGSACLTLDLENNSVVAKTIDTNDVAQTWKVKYTLGDDVGCFTAANGANGLKLRLKLRDNATSATLICADARPTSFWTIIRQGNPDFVFITHEITSTLDLNYTTLGEPVTFSTRVAVGSPESHRYVFEPCPEPPQRRGRGRARGAASEFERTFFNLDIQGAKDHGPYDYIIVGTGIGGGVIARDLYETNSKLGSAAKNILVIEKGGLVFHSHCLNTSRPEGLGNNRGQQNDTFFALFKDEYDITHPNSTDPSVPPSTWKGGPMHCVGGRSAAWGLFSPRVHDDTLRKWFPASVAKDLKETYFVEAEKLFNLSLPKTKIVHQHLIERLNIDARNAFKVNWQWGRIASEFRDENNFDFAEGAYSTIDKLLEIMMSKPYVSADSDERKEHTNFKMLIRTEVRKIQFNDANKATGVFVKTEGSAEDDVIPLKPDGKVILAAGSVASPAILMRSGVDLSQAGAGMITDHDILYRALSFRYLKPEDRAEVGSMKLQTYFDMDDRAHQWGLANMSIDASSFLPRANSVDKNLPQMIMSFILPCPLERKCTITMSNEEPKVNMVRTEAYERPDRDRYLERMKAVTESAVGVIEESLGVEFVDRNGLRNGEYLSYLELGGVAHELGSLPMPGSGSNSRHAIDENLKLSTGQDGVYVCDLSIFPMSPEANPTLTLAGLAIRLSRQLVPRTMDRPLSATDNTVWILNQSGEAVQVWVSNYGNVTRTEEQLERELRRTFVPAGQCHSVERRNGIDEAVFVFRWDRLLTFEEVDNGAEMTFSKEPELFVVHPGLQPLVIS